MEIFTNFSHVVGKFVVTKKCIVMVICLFRNGMRNVITPLWMIIKNKFNYILHSLLQRLYHIFGKQDMERGQVVKK